MTGNYETILYMAPNYDGEVLDSYYALDRIVDAIKAIQTKEDYDRFSIAWFDYIDGENGDVVVSIYASDEEEGCGIDDEGDCVEKKCWCQNDDVAHDYIYYHLSKKRDQLLRK